MPFLNLCQFIGNVGADPTIRSNSGNPEKPEKIAFFNLATTERYKGRDGQYHDNTEWIPVVAFGPTAEFVEKYVRKGSPLFVSGKFRTRSWNDQSGARRFQTEILAQDIQPLARREETQQAAPAPVGVPTPPPTPAPIPTPVQAQAPVAYPAPAAPAPAVNQAFSQQGGQMADDLPF
jgi:single-strand DNA-binding protein